MSRAQHEQSGESDDGTPAGGRSVMAPAIMERALPG
jgi:hypothetical protein